MGAVINASNATTGAGFGIKVTMSGATNSGVAVSATNASGVVAYGVKATVSGSGNFARAVYGANTVVSNCGFGVFGTNAADSTSTGGIGVYGSATGASNKI